MRTRHEMLTRTVPGCLLTVACIELAGQTDRQTDRQAHGLMDAHAHARTHTPEMSIKSSGLQRARVVVRVYKCPCLGLKKQLAKR
jgi:hypothetical protein